MLTLEILGAAGINDPDFLYILGFQIMVFASTCIVGSWIVYRLLSKHRPGLNETYKILATVAIIIVAVCLIGFATELIGL